MGEALNIYVGQKIETDQLVVIRSDVTPTEETHGDRFKYVIGPFRSLRFARAMAHSWTIEEADSRRFGP
jgi:hypothetical protein